MSAGHTPWQIRLSDDDGVPETDLIIETAGGVPLFVGEDNLPRKRMVAHANLAAAAPDLLAALQPFVDLGPQRGAWGVISKKLDGLAPLTVTVTKAQMLAAFAACARATGGAS